ncbi:MAG: NRDE family protein [Blastocatellia bacterium]
MCTVSWIHQDDGYHLLCNRDERHTRKPALPPRVHEHSDVRFIAPIDGDHGGSWIGVNQFGLSLCLLNRYKDGEQSATGSKKSRGLLLAGLMDAPSRAEVHNSMLETDLSRFQPFTLVALEPQKKALLVHWTGRECVSDLDGEGAMPLTSSSYDPVGAGESRQHCFERLVSGPGKTAELLFRFHASHEPVRGPYSTCMHRDDARTVSFSWIRVAAGKIEFCYHPVSPCSLWPDTGRVSTALEMSRTLR